MRKMRELGVQIETPAQLAVMWEAGQVVAAAGQPMPADLTEGGFVIRAAEPRPAGWGGGAGYAQ
jgi:hypothetical protein